MDVAFMSKICERLIRAGIATTDEIRGCSLEETDELESYVKGQFPQSYKIFLLTMGRGAGKFFEGTDIFYPEILEIRRGAEDLLDEDNSDFELSTSDFVFALHQGYQFMYFSVVEDVDDPPVYYYMEGAEASHKKWASFSEFLLKSVHDYENMPSTSI